MRQRGINSQLSMKKIGLLIVALMVTVVTFAQRTVKGTVVEQDTQEAVIQATAALLSGEKVVANAVTNTEGGFSIKAPVGSYTLQVPMWVSRRTRRRSR